MELKDLLNLSEMEIKGIIRTYYDQTIVYRYENSFEDFLSEIVECNNCHEYCLKDEMCNEPPFDQDNVCIHCVEDGYGR